MNITGLTGNPNGVFDFQPGMGKTVSAIRVALTAFQSSPRVSNLLPFVDATRQEPWPSKRLTAVASAVRLAI
ncbi:MAG TPA: hypothetical protein VJ608_15350 [Albitalea sp.]|nr:hypothetical protein [Albitalea sp.]